MTAQPAPAATDMNMPLPEPDAEILKLAREHAPVIYTNRHFPDAPAFSFPSSKLIAFARAYAAAEVAKEREKWESLCRAQGFLYMIEKRAKMK